MGEGLPSGLMRFIALSVVAHLGVFAGVIAFGQLSSARTVPVQNVMVTKLVRLGKERPPEFLPRKPQEPPPPAAPAVAPLTPPSPTAPKAPALATAKDRVAELSQVSRALDRLKKRSEPDTEGHPDGVVEGEVSSLAQAVAGNRFMTEVYRCIKDNYAVEGIDASRVKNRTALVVVRVDADGRFIEHRIERSSGLDAFDRAVELAMRRCARVSAPPEEIRDMVRKNGIEVEFQP